MLAHTQIQTGRHCDVLERTSCVYACVNVQGDLKLQNIYILNEKKRDKFEKILLHNKAKSKGKDWNRQRNWRIYNKGESNLFHFFCVCCFILFPFNSSSTPRSFHQHNDLMLECTFSLFSFKRSPILTRFSISNAFSISLSVFTLRCSCFKVLHFGKIVHLFFSSLCWKRMGFPFAILLCLIFSFAIFFCSNTIVFSICAFCIILSRKFFILQSFDDSLFPYCDNIMTIPYCCEIFSHFATKLYSVHPSAHFDLFAIYFSRIRLDNVDEISKIRLQFERERKENVIEKSTKCIWIVFYRFHVQSICNELYLFFLFHLRHI